MNEVRFAAATYNIHRCVGRDRRRDAHRLLSVLEALQAPIIALQEVETLIGLGPEHDQFVYLASQLGMHAIAGPAMFEPQSSYGNALLSAYPVRSVHRHNISVPGREPRGAVEAELLIEGQPVRVITTHLGLSARERMRQCRALAKIIEARRPIPTMLLGDFNEWVPFARALTALRRHAADRGCRSFPSAAPVLSLDRVFVTPELTITNLRAFRRGDAARASDHLPVRAELRLQRAAP